MREIQIRENEAGQRFDKFLRKYLRSAGDGFIYKMLRKKNITLNKKRACGSEILQVEDRVYLYLSEETLEKFSGGGGIQLSSRIKDMEAGSKKTAASARVTSCPLTFLYEDEQIALINKPAGLLSQGDSSGDASVVELFLSELLSRGELTYEELRRGFRPGICNRLDRNTSGIIVAGKTLAALQELSAAFRERRVEKYYQAVVAGRFCSAQMLSGYLQKDPVRNRVSIIPENDVGPYAEGEKITDLLMKGQEQMGQELSGQEQSKQYQFEQKQTGQYQSGQKQIRQTQTELEPSEQKQTGQKQVGQKYTGQAGLEKQEKSKYMKAHYVPLAVGDALTLLSVELMTGRTHQIRAQLAGIGHPVIGDGKYGDRDINRRYRDRYGITRQLLHASTIHFGELSGRLSYLSGKSFTAPLSCDFIEIIKKERLKEYGNG